MDTAPIIMFIIFFSLVAIIKIISENRTKRALIHKGELNKELLRVIQSGYDIQPLNAVKWGLVLIGIGLALLLSQIFPEAISDEATFGLMFLFAGIGFLIYYKMMKRHMTEKQ